jgi:signal transduction histidine kinase
VFEKHSAAYGKLPLFRVTSPKCGKLRISSIKRRNWRLVGQLTGGIAHDFNNLLTTILGNLELLTARLGADDQCSARQLSAARTAAEHGARLTTQLVAFSRQQRMAPEPVDLNRIVTGMHGLLQSAVGAANRIEVALAGPLSLALADPSQIELVILNLAIKRAGCDA